MGIETAIGLGTAAGATAATAGGAAAAGGATAAGTTAAVAGTSLLSTIGSVLGTVGTIGSLASAIAMPIAASARSKGLSTLSTPKMSAATGDGEANNRGGRMSAILTGPQGLLSDAPTGRKKLLGA